ncbi:uncharacterized protein LOC111588137 isoform X2 [Amphiprion ocellaris]|uniref:uncharacterized protein LOC111588137 isoform X2 n=1 Tax=Amphiprion ocellaris TaxID=80972 RepID=UPI002410B708|nr:uncharacterized protein LOC111588137 isoform X2 [Amphiprion ocellaris]
MRSLYLFLLVYLQGIFTGGSHAQRNTTCSTEACGPVPDTTSHFLQCVGLPSTDTGPDHMHRLKEMLEATMDLYTFMRTSVRGVPFLSLQGELELNWKADPLQNEALVQMWLEVKIKPLLKSVTKQFLTCLSTKNFSCSTYQTVVKELSHHYSEMHPVRQKWIYMFFMYPFLSGDRVAGCVNPSESSEEWLMKNFGSFRAMARMKDFSTLNMVFSGLKVLHLLSPEQKAELLMRPEVAGLDNGTLSLVFHSLMTGGSGPPPTAGPGWGHSGTTTGWNQNWTTPGWNQNWTTPGWNQNWTTPGWDQNWTTPGWDQNWTTPGWNQNWTTPGWDQNWTTPGWNQNWTTPGWNQNWTTPGWDQNWTTPGWNQNWTTPGWNQNWTTPGWNQNWTTPGWGYNYTSPRYPTISPSYPPEPTYKPYPPSPQHALKEVAEGFMMAFKPISSFVHDFVAFTEERDVSEIRSTTLTQFLLNWTLAELADMYRPPNKTALPEIPKFDVTNVEDWYRQVVMPLLRRFLPDDSMLMHENITLAFHKVFYLDHGKGNESSEIQDVCSITLDKNPCALTDTVKNVAHVLHCAARTNLTMNEETVMRLIEELTKRLNSLIRELATANFTEVAHDFHQIFREPESPSLTQEHLEDPDFIKLWFKVKLLPHLPDIHPDLLSCLSTKNFSCPVYQTIVADLGRHVAAMDADPMYSENIYEHFIYPFLLHHNTSDPQCVSSAIDSTEWLKNNFGFFSRFASVISFYQLNPRFSGLKILRLLSPKQLAEMLLLPLPTPPQKDVVIEQVFDFFLDSPELRKLPEVLHFAVQLAAEVNPPCEVYTQILERLYKVIPALPPGVEPAIWPAVDDLINVAPLACVPDNLTCPVTQFNETKICKGVDSSDLQSHFNTSMQVPCNITLEKYACAQLENFTADQLVSLMKCNLSGNSSHSRVLWKMLLTKVSLVLVPALDLLGDMSTPVVIPSAVEILDVIGEVRLVRLTDEQLMNSSVIRLWFSDRLGGFLPSASGGFLRCLSNKNLSCQSYQQILQVFVQHLENMTLKQQHVVLKNFILRFLQQPRSDPGCVSAFNSTAEWLKKNLGPFSVLLSLKELLDLNPQFNPLEVIPLLTPEQSAELVLLPLPEKDIIIDTLFDYFTESPNKKKFSEFLSYLVKFSPQGNFSCSSYRTLYTRLDLAMATVSLQTASAITYSKMSLSKHIPPGCIIYSTQCNVTMTNETDICVGVNSTKLQLLLDSAKMSGRFCEFSVEELACASLSALKAQDLAEMLKCNRSSSSSGSRPVWKLLLSKASLVLDEALDLLTNTTLNPKNPAVSLVLNAIREIRFDNISLSSINDPALIQLWFNRRLLPFLSAVSPDFLSCFITKGLNCNTYQYIVQTLTRLQPNMTLATQMSVYTHFIKIFLTRNNTADPSCSSNINNSVQWLQRNLGGFSVLVPFSDIRMLYPSFSAMEALSQLSVRQLAHLSSTPGQLTSAQQVNMVLNHVPNRLLTAFFDDYSPAIMGHENMFPSPVRSAMLQAVFDRANLSNPSVSDQDVLRWLRNRLQPLLFNLSPSHVAPFFGILTGRNCSTEQQGVEDLNLTISTLSGDTLKQIHNHITETLKGSEPLRCYGDNYNHSFYSFVERSFLGFQFPNLTAFLSLMPHDRMHLLVNSIPVSDVGDFLRRPDVVDNNAELCALYQNYNLIQMLLQKESLPEVVRLPTLECVWPIALSSSNRPDVEMWFSKSLTRFYPLLRKDMIGPNVTHNASCLAFQQLVKFLGEHNSTAADFTRKDVFMTIRDYLNSDTVPRCYNNSNPELNSTAWFVEYIGPFMPFLTLEVLQTFGSAEDLQVFTVNLENIALLNHSVLPQNLTDYYTQLVYQEDSNFNPLLLPLLCRCVAPGLAFSQLTANQSMMLLPDLTRLCADLDPQVAAALAGNFGDKIDASAIATLGNESVGISTGQIARINPQDLFKALGTLRLVMGWNEGQARAIIQALMSSGMMQINSSSSLFMLGSLIVGVPTKVFKGISISQLLTASKNTSVLAQLMLAPPIVQQTFVTQIISVNTNSEQIIQNIPDELATEIPRSLLLGFSNNSSVLTTINKKKWKRQQAELFFSVIAAETATAQLGTPNNLSSSVLQGFTCTGVRTIQRVQIKRLVRACRRRGRNKVKLVETQLTCMYNYIRVDPDATNFTVYPPDMLLYYDYSLVPQASCRSYFEQLADADFSVFSSALSYKRTDLFDNARSCLAIKNTSLTGDNISVLGNMCCTLDGSYIQNSDPSILEKLKNCPEITDAQAAAVETLLSSGNTQCGAPSTWNEQTLRDLGMLPLYLKSTFYKNFDKKTKRMFLKFFLKVLRNNKVDRWKRRSMKREIRRSNRMKSKRSIGSECTVGEITQVTISAETFPFDYDDINQFNCCLTAKTVQDNLDAITEKVDQEEYLQIVLSKLQEAYAANSSIPESQVQLLGPASRLATAEYINKWIITQIDTLAALMDLSDGEWDPNLAKDIITKYLSTEGNTLGSAELNAIGGPNLCSLDADVLKNISQQSLRDADALNVSNCTKEKKQELFTIARQAFSGDTRSTVSVSSYQLVQPYMGGATSDYVKSLVAANVSMDLPTFTNMDETVVLNLTVSDVQGLLGTNLADLKSYENQTLVQSWVSRQSQTELDTLGIGLEGGRVDPTASTVTTTASSSSGTTINSTATTAATASPASTAATSATTTAGSGSSSSTSASSTTTGNGNGIRADAGFSLLVLLALLITSQHAIM